MGTNTFHERAYALLSEAEYDELIVYITPHVKAKDSWAEAILGQCYSMGAGAEKDLAVARHYHELSANQNDPHGQLLLGHHLLFEGNVEEGRKHLESAFEGGSATAADYLANSFLMSPTNLAQTRLLWA